jgi:glutathione S-transferase
VLDDNGFILAESNAILAYLARGTKYLPENRKKFGLVFQWLFSNNTATNLSSPPRASGSSINLTLRKRAALLASKRDGGWAALKIMEDQLTKSDFFVGDYSIADIALFAYTHVAD